MKRTSRAGALLAVAALLLAACQRSEKVGEGLLEKLKEQEQQRRLGEFLKSPEPTGQPSPAALGGSPAPGKTGGPQREVFQVLLVNDPPYYEPGQQLTVPLGTTIRVTNKDDNTRSFTTPDGPYDSGDLAPGQSRELVVNVKGKFQLYDPNVPFATGTLEVF